MIITLTGENDVMRQEALRQIVDNFLSSNDELALERIDGEEAEYAHMHEAVQSLPFLAPRKLVVMRSPGQNKEFVERFEQLITEVADTNDVVILEPKLDKRLAYYKQLKKLTDFKDFAKLDDNSLSRFLVDYAKKQGGNLSSVDARLLIDRVGVNQLLLTHELDKLLAYDPRITRATVELLTERMPQSSIFELLDAAFAGDVRQTMHLYDEQRALRVEPQQIIAMLVWQLYILAIAKAAGSRNAEVIAGEAHLSPFTIRKSVGLARRISTTRLKRLIRDLRTFDVRLKSEGLNADEVVRYYLLSLG